MGVAKCRLTIVGAVAQLERDYLKDRQMKGITIAVIECRYKRRKPIGYPKLWKRYYKMMQDGDISGVDVMKNIRFKENYIL